MVELRHALVGDKCSKLLLISDKGTDNMMAVISGNKFMVENANGN